MRVLNGVDFQTTSKRTGYVGALAYNGAHGLDSSIPYYMPMELAGVENILSDAMDYEGSGKLILT